MVRLYFEDMVALFHFEEVGIEGEITLKIEYLCGNSKITTDKG